MGPSDRAQWLESDAEMWVWLTIEWGPLGLAGPPVDFVPVCGAQSWSNYASRKLGPSIQLAVREPARLWFYEFEIDHHSFNKQAENKLGSAHSYSARYNLNLYYKFLPFGF